MTTGPHDLPEHHDTQAVEAAARIVREVRQTASRLTFAQRADFLRNLVRAVYDAVKFDPLFGGLGPGGPEDECVGMGLVGDAAEAYRDEAIETDLRARGRLS